jgi:hypothetical protein
MPADRIDLERRLAAATGGDTSRGHDAVHEIEWE